MIELNGPGLPGNGKPNPRALSFPEGVALQLSVTIGLGHSELLLQAGTGRRVLK